MDARSLLRAKKAESRIDHPHATYTNTGQLRCSICAIPVKQWDAHLLTKQHRTSLAREKSSASGSAKSKRPADSESGGESTKRARTETEEVVKSSILPAGFFSSGNGPKIVRGDDDDEEEEEVPSIPAAGPSKAKAKPAPAPAPSAPAPTKPTAAPVATQTGDEELDSFLASLAEPDPVEPAPEPASAGPAPTAATQKSTSRKPTTSSYRDIIPGQASYEAAPVRNIPKDQEVEPEPEVQESEAERRARVAREEKEEIMDRLEDEERAQEDGDSRVAALKQRMEMLKKRREAKAKAGGKGTAA